MGLLSCRGFSLSLKLSLVLRIGQRGGRDRTAHLDLFEGRDGVEDDKLLLRLI